MTYDEMTRSLHGELILPSRLRYPKMPNKAVPQAVNSFNQSPPHPISQEDYNAIPLSQMQDLSKFRGMDELHLADAVASDFDRGNKLNAVANSMSKENFVQLYKNAKK